MECEEIVKQLQSSDKIMKKSALAILKESVAPNVQKSPWSEFFGIMSALDDFGAHLVNAVWEPACKLHSNYQVSSGDVWSFRYMSAFWYKALCHENPSVRAKATNMMINGVEWTKDGMKDVISVPLIMEALLPAVMVSKNVDKMREDTCQNDPPLSDKEAFEPHARFIQQWVISSDWEATVSSLLQACGHALEMPKLVTLDCYTHLIVSIAQGIESSGMQSVGSAEFSVNVIHALTKILKSIEREPDFQFQKKFCKRIMDSVIRLLPLREQPVQEQDLFNFLKAIPAQVLGEPEGIVRTVARGWIHGSDGRATSVHIDFKVELEKAFILYINEDDTTTCDREAQLQEELVMIQQVRKLAIWTLLCLDSERRELLQVVISFAPKSLMPSNPHHRRTAEVRALWLLKSIIILCTDFLNASENERRTATALIEEVKQNICSQEWCNDTKSIFEFKNVQWSECMECMKLVAAAMNTIQALLDALVTDNITQKIIGTSVQNLIENFTANTFQLFQESATDGSMTCIYLLRTLSSGLQGLRCAQLELSANQLVSITTELETIAKSWDEINDGGTNVLECLKKERLKIHMHLATATVSGSLDGLIFLRRQVLITMLDTLNVSVDVLSQLRCIGALLDTGIILLSFNSDKVSVQDLPEEMRDSDKLVWMIVHKVWNIMAQKKWRAHGIVWSSACRVALHSSIFDKFERPLKGSYSTKESPSRWFVSKAIAMNINARIVRVIGHALCGRLLTSYIAGSHFVKELWDLALICEGGLNRKDKKGPNFGTTEEDIDEAWLKLEFSKGGHANSMATRVGIMHVVHLIAQAGNNGDGDALLSAVFLIQHGLSLVMEDPDIICETYRRFSSSHSRKIRSWQMMCCLTPALPSILSEYPELSLTIYDAAKFSLALNNLKEVRTYQEMFFSFVAGAYKPFLLEIVLPSLKSSDGVTPSTRISWMLITIAQGLKNKNDSEFQMKVLAAVFPWIAAHNHALRVMSQVAVFQLLESRPMDGLDECVHSLYRVLKNNTHMIKARQGIYPVAGHLVGDSSPRSLLQSAADAGFEGAPFCVYDKMDLFLSQERQITRNERTAIASVVWKHMLHVDNMRPPRGKFDFTGVVPVIENPAEQTEQNTEDVGEMVAMQKKIDPKHQPSPLEQLGEQMQLETNILRNSEDELNALPIEDARPSGLIVVASLVSKIQNLAGLSRTCEVFGVEALVLADAEVTSRRDFISVSMTAEKWLPIREVPVLQLKTYLLHLKKNDYTVIGLEQTTKSHQLASYNFPKKSVLVLGHEREGISVDILPLLDVCVEIPQKGLIRSLNVHVSASIAIHHYVSSFK
eukprot:m.51759 g.51759  ORF g.51759 m.51759 type:complete len:1326 (+) comp10752_c0_seq2:406-4383(+)